LEEPGKEELADDVLVVEGGVENSIFREKAWQKIQMIVEGLEGREMPTLKL
jgi:hypothetical protein